MLFDIVRDGRFIYETIPFWFDVLLLGTFLSLIFRQGALTSGVADDKNAGFWGVFLGFLVSFSSVAYAYNQGASLLLYVVGPYGWMLFCIVIGILIWDYLDGRFAGQHRIWTIPLAIAITLWLFSVLLAALGFSDLIAGPLRDILSIILWIGFLLLLFLGLPRLVLWGFSSLGGAPPAGPRHPPAPRGGSPAPSSGGSSWWNPRSWFGGPSGTPPGPAPSGGPLPDLDEIEEINEDVAKEAPRVFAKLGKDFKKANENTKSLFGITKNAEDFFEELNKQIKNLSSYTTTVRKDVEKHKGLHPDLAQAFNNWSVQVSEAGDASVSHFDALLASIEALKGYLKSISNHPDSEHTINYLSSEISGFESNISSLLQVADDTSKAKLQEANDELEKLRSLFSLFINHNTDFLGFRENIRKFSPEPEKQSLSRLKEELKKILAQCSSDLANVERNSSARLEKILESINTSQETSEECSEKIKEVLSALARLLEFLEQSDKVSGNMFDTSRLGNDVGIEFTERSEKLVEKLKIIEQELNAKNEEAEKQGLDFASELKSQKELLDSGLREIQDDLFSLSDKISKKDWMGKPLERKQYEIAQIFEKISERKTFSSLLESVSALLLELESKPKDPLTKQELALRKAFNESNETFIPFEEQLLKSFDKSKKGALAEKEDYWQTQVPQEIKTLTGTLEKLRKFVPVLNVALLKLKNK